MKVAIYSRYSTDKQTESSIADQQRVCEAYAMAQGWKVTQRFEDQGISGGTLGRPGFKAALAYLGSGDILLVIDTTRFSRSQDLAPQLARLKNRGVRVIGVNDGFDNFSRVARMQAGLSGIMSEEYRAQISDRTRDALESRAREGFSTGGAAYGYASEPVGDRFRHVVDPAQAKVVREIFQLAADGTSCREIAKLLNARGVASPGAAWKLKKRKVRKAQGWKSSAVRALLLNRRYCGELRWNASRWVRDPDEDVRHCHERPAAEWVVRKDERLRIVDSALFERVQKRFKPEVGSKHSRSGGKRRYLLSGLLSCGECGSAYTIADARSYACGAHTNGGKCSNGIRVRRDHAETTLLDPIRKELLAPDRVAKMAAEMQKLFAARQRAAIAKAAEVPAEIAALDERLTRLRRRLKAGDPDLSAEDLAAAIERGEAQRAELEKAEAAKAPGGKVVTILPRAAALYRDQIAKGLNGDPRAADRARVLLRDLFGGKIRLERKGQELWAHWNLSPGALLRAQGTSGSGGRI